MSFPPLVHYKTTNEYRKHYERIYCRGPILTFDKIPVWFIKSWFKHNFSKSSKRDGCKDIFSVTRLERINWIKSTLQNPNADLYCGWDKFKRRHDPTRRVAVIYDDYIVIIWLKWKQNGTLEGQFVTAYVADNSIEKIRCSPRWKIEMIKK